MVTPITFITLFASAAMAFAEVTFTPIPSEYEVEGLKFKNVEFADGARRSSYTPPLGWRYTGDDKKLSLSPEGKELAAAYVEKIELKEVGTFDEAEAKALTEQIMASLPKGSTNIEAVGAERNPVMVVGRDTFDVVVNYSFFGQTLTRSVMYVNRDKGRFRCVLDCKRDDFAVLHRQFQGSFCSWQDL